MLLLLLACHARPACDAGETRRNGACWPYEAGAPVRATGWQPGVGTTWQVQYTGTLDRSVDVDAFDVDLFDTDEATIDLLRANGHHVLCYFSAGSYEDWRPDAASFEWDQLRFGAKAVLTFSSADRMPLPKAITNRPAGY